MSFIEQFGWQILFPMLHGKFLLLSDYFEDPQIKIIMNALAICTHYLFVEFGPPIQMNFCVIFSWHIAHLYSRRSFIFFFLLSSDAGNSVWGGGGLDPRCAPRWGEGGRRRAGRVRPAPPHVSPPGCWTGPERRAAALRHPSYHQAAGPTTLLAYRQGERRRGSCWGWQKHSIRSLLIYRHRGRERKKGSPRQTIIMSI